MYITRAIEGYLTEVSRQFPVVLLTGARQVGKTTVLRHLGGRDRTCISLDDPRHLELARADPALFLQRYPPPLLIDEIQYAPQLLPLIKMAVDAKRRPGAYWLTGSQQFHLMRGVSESLAGRVAVARLLGLSRREILGEEPAAEPFLPTEDGLRKRRDRARPLTLAGLYDTIHRGSFPSLISDKSLHPETYFGSFTATYLQRDVRDLARVGDEMAFLRFLRASAARTGQLLNISEVSRDAGVSPVTGGKWLSILEASGLIYLLEPWYANPTRRMVKRPKLYFLDTGLAAYLLDYVTPGTLEAGALTGAILETWIMGELLKSWWNNGLRAPFHYYRDHDQKEIDLLIIQNGVVHPLEFKKTASPGRHSVQHFSLLNKLGMPVGPGGVLCLTPDLMPLTDKFWSIPVSLL
ncbi:MAG: DUF4143 domain-containing protein [Methylobacteriaceae bacterium]|jgi:predicted AAA+ superfamily ATPase|nr:DUF4143 domain-containing protein [Methylobacteriaceae bacterium]